MIVADKKWSDLDAAAALEKGKEKEVAEMMEKYFKVCDRYVARR